MRELIQAAFVTSIIFIADMITDTKKKFYTYVIIFLLIAGIGFTFSKGFAAEVEFLEKVHFSSTNFVRNAQIEIEVLKESFASPNFALDINQRLYYQQLIEHHRIEGDKAYIESKEKCWWLPNLTDREKARYCYTTALAGIATGTPGSKIVVMTITLLGQYGLDCIDEWHKIKTLLHSSQYHYEMMEFYQNVLNKS